MKTAKKLLAMLMVLCLSIAVSLPAFADTTDGPTEAKNGVLQLTVQVFVNSEEIYRSSGTAFLINESHVVTNYHVIGFSTSDMEVLSAVQQAGADVEIRYKVYSKRDVYREAALVQTASSAEMDFAVLELESPIGGRTPLALGDSDSVADLDAIYALGFPSDSLQVQDIIFHDSGDVAATRGVISKSLTVDGVNYFQHDATVSAGSSGGPLVNEEGAVVGINTLQGLTSQDFYIVDEDGTAVLQSYGHIDFNGAIKVNELRDVLDQAMITYTSADGPVNNIDDEPEDVEPTEEVIETVDYSSLEYKIDEAKVLDSSKYTAESWGVLESNLESAETVLNDSAASQEQVDKKTSDLDSAIKQLEEEKGINGVLIGVIAAIVVVIIVLVIVLVVVLGNGKKSKKPPVGSVPPVMNPNNSPYGQTPSNIQPMNNYQTAATDEGAGETSVLSEGAGETTVLGGGGGANAYLIRTKNGEKIMLNSPNFVIGKEKKRVNYCIADNTSISRSHARIVKKGTQYFIVDMNSTNFTIVNGVKLAANIETPLENGAKIRLSDEDFEFYM